MAYRCLAVIYPSGLTRALQWGPAAAVLALNAVLYARIVRARRNDRD